MRGPHDFEVHMCLVQLTRRLPDGKLQQLTPALIKATLLRQTIPKSQWAVTAACLLHICLVLRFADGLRGSAQTIHHIEP